MKYSLRQLQVFLAVARTENISQAAKDLSMSQSAVSSALADLEKRYEMRLFDRHGKKLQLNELGRALRPRAVALYEQAGEFEQLLQEGNAAPALRIGATLTIGNYLAVDIMARYMNQHPGSQVQLHVANTATISKQVGNFEFDIGLVEGELQHPDLDIKQWMEDELVVFCSPSNPLARKKSLSDKDLKEAAWILRESGSGTRQTFDRAMHGIITQLNIGLELEHTEAIKRAVEADLGVGCLSRLTLTEAFNRGRLVPLNAPHRDFRRYFYFVLHRQKYISTGIDSWLKLCKQTTV